MDAFFFSLPVWANAVLFALGLLIIVKAADWFLHGAVGVAQITGIPKMIIGATLVSLATTAAEFSVAVIAAWLAHPATSVGTAVGSTICNIGLILGVAAFLAPVTLRKRDIVPKGAIMLGLGAALIFTGWDRQLDKGEGLFLLAMVPLYMWFIVKWSKRAGAGEPTIEETTVEEVMGEEPGGGEPAAATESMSRVGLLFLAGAVLVVLGSVLLVENAVPLAKFIGVPELVVALTLVAVGTSLPELVTAISASSHGHGEVAVGNVAGANILNIAWVLGSASAITPLEIDAQSISLDFPFMIAMMVLFMLFFAWRGRVGRRAGLVFLSGYGLYMAIMFGWFA